MITFMLRNQQITIFAFQSFKLFDNTMQISPTTFNPKSKKVATNQAKIYIRRVNKITVEMKVVVPIQIQWIMSQASMIFQVPPKSILLFFNGVNITQQSHIAHLGNNCVVHMLNLNNTNHQQLTILFKSVSNPQKTFTLLLSPERTIKSLLKNQIKQQTGKGLKQIFLIYVGKALPISSTLKESFMENQAQVLIADYIPKKKSEAIFRTISIEKGQQRAQVNESRRLLSPQKGLSSKSEHELSQTKKEQQMKSKIQKTVSLKEIEKKEKAGAEPQEDDECEPHKVMLQILKMSLQSKQEDATPTVDESVEQEFKLIEEVSSIIYSKQEEDQLWSTQE